MTNNKFWLVLTEKQAQEKFLTKELAINVAREIAQKKKKPMYLMECVKVFDVDINVTETSFEPTPEDSLAVKSKYKIGDNVLYLDHGENCAVSWYSGVVIDIIDNEYMKIQDKISQCISTYLLSSPLVKLAE